MICDNLFKPQEPQRKHISIAYFFPEAVWTAWGRRWDLNLTESTVGSGPQIWNLLVYASPCPESEAVHRFWIPVRFINARRGQKMVFIKGDNQALKKWEEKKKKNYENTEVRLHVLEEVFLWPGTFAHFEISRLGVGLSLSTASLGGYA